MRKIRFRLLPTTGMVTLSSWTDQRKITSAQHTAALAQVAKDGLAPRTVVDRVRSILKYRNGGKALPKDVQAALRALRQEVSFYLLTENL